MGILDLWLPILASSVIVFVMSALVWMVLPWHKADFRKTPDEEAVRATLKGIGVGQYMVPYCADPAELKDPAVAQKYIDGPSAVITVMPNGAPTMSRQLVLSFLYNVLVGTICAYVVSRTLAAGSDYLEVFRIAGTTAFIAYGIAYVQDSIWFGRPWSLTAKGLLDALIYGSLIGGTFGWLV